MNMSSMPRSVRAVLIFLTFAVIGPVLGCIILGFIGSGFLAPLANPEKVKDGSLFLYIFLMAFAFGAIPAVISGLIMVFKFLRSGYFRAGDAVFAAFTASALVGPAYHYFNGNNPLASGKMTISMFVACLTVGPVAALCGFLSHKSAQALGLIVEPGKQVDAELVP